MTGKNSGEVTYGRSIIKCAFSAVINVLSGVLIGALMIFMLGISESQALRVIAQVLALIFYVVMIYVGAWSEGDRDKNLVNFNRIKKDIFKGFKFGFLAMIPFNLMTVMLIVAMYVQNETTALILRSSYRILNFNLLLLINKAMSPDTVTWSGIGWVNLFYLTIPVVSGIAYILGYKRIAVMNKLVYSKKESEKKKKKSRY